MTFITLSLILPWKHRFINLTLSARNVMEIRNIKAHAECDGISVPEHIMTAPIEEQIYECRDFCLVSKKKMLSINKWFSRDEEKKKEKEREEAYFKYLKDMNFKLVGGKSTVKEEVLKRLTAEENKDIHGKLREDYMRMKQKQKAEREEIMRKYQHFDSINKSPNVVLTSALKHAATLFERQKHVELREKLKLEEKEWKGKEQEELNRQMKIAEELDKQAENNRRRKEDEVKTFVLNQCRENAENKQKAHIDRITQEQEDFMKSTAEWTEMLTNERQKKLIKKKENLDSLKRAAEKVQARGHLEKKEEEEIHKVNEVINNSKFLRDCLVKEQMRKDRKEKTCRNEIAAFECYAQIPSVEQNEETVYQNGLLQSKLEYEKKINEKVNLLKAQASEKNLNYQEDFQRRKEKEREISELKRMEILERYKKAEAMQYYDEINKQKEIEKKRAYRQDLIQQEFEIQENKKLEKKLEDDYVLSSLEKEDIRFSEYADEVLKYAEDRNWPTFPIKKAIKEHKKKQHVVFRKQNDFPRERS